MHKLRLLSAVVILIFAIWGAFALWFQLALWPVAILGILLAGWLGSGIAAAMALCRHAANTPKILGGYLLLAAVLLGWWHSLSPSHHRHWADDVAQLLESRIEGDKVSLNNVRNFNWHSETDYSPRWESRQYDLSQLVSADLVLSYWMGPHIAHTLVSFGFADGQQLVFSLEIRKEQHESFSAIGGFFRQFEQVIIAADEQDIIYTRSNARQEEVYLYRLAMTQPQLRRLFLGYLDTAETLRSTPQFYNTLSSNCTTIVFDLARQIAPTIPLDYRLLLSGHFAEYAYELGALTPGYSYSELKARGYINPRTQHISPEANFSNVIRMEIPTLPQQVK